MRSAALSQPADNGPFGRPGADKKIMCASECWGRMFIICHYHFMCVRMTNREVGGCVAYVEMSAIHVKFVRKLQG
jgi:hypothetical protein